MPTPKLNGLELVKRVKDGIFPHSTMAATIPMKIIAVKKGTVKFIRPIRESCTENSLNHGLNQTKGGSTK